MSIKTVLSAFFMTSIFVLIQFMLPDVKTFCSEVKAEHGNILI